MLEGLDTTSELSLSQKRALLADLLSGQKECAYPLSLAQQRLWYLDQLEPGNSAYNVPFGLRLRGPLNPDALNRSVREIVRRHAILRTRFSVEDGSPVQVVAPTCVLDMPLLDLCNSLNAEADAYQHAAASIAVPFDLATGPLVRLELIRLGTEEHILLCVMHHIVCDAWSLGILMRELAVLYGEFAHGAPSSLLEPRIQYGDYAAWQRDRIARHRSSDEMQYWKQTLAGAPEFLELPTDFPRPELQSYEGASQAIGIPQELISPLMAIGRKQQATLFMVMFAAFNALIHAYTGVDDLIVGIPVANRDRVELEDLIGFFVNTLVLRSTFSEGISFNSLLLRTREVAIGAFAHADFPFEKLVEALNPRRTMSHNPIFQIMFSHLKIGRVPQFGGLNVSPYVVGSATSPFDLAMNFIEEADEQFWLRVEYKTTLFSPQRMTRLLKDYSTLLNAVVTNPDIRLSELSSLLNAEEPIASRITKLHAIERIVPNSSLDGAQPRDAQQQILARIWEKVLGIPNIGSHDDFFDLGGHSLLAARLMVEVQSALGCSVPLAALLRHSTIASLSQVLHEAKPWAPDPLLVELQRGRGGVPIFAVAAPGVETLGYAKLARHMGADQAFYKLQAHAATPSDLPYSADELQQLAKDSIAAMRAIQPRGPYFLVATCGGVHIAEQMVLELETHGHSVGLFAIIDTWVLQNRQIRWLERINYYSHRLRSLLRQPITFQLNALQQFMQRERGHMGGQNHSVRDPWFNVHWPGKDFQPPCFNAPVLIFKRPRQPYYYVNDPELGWGKRSREPVEICVIDAAHEAMLREPSVQIIAQQLRKTSDRMTNGLPAVDTALRQQRSNGDVQITVHTSADSSRSGTVSAP
jgi:thioesterase domain-containing protein/acyl carrier protein